MDQQEMVTLVSEQLGAREFTKDHAENLLAWQKRNNHNHWQTEKAKKKTTSTPAIANETHASNEGTGTNDTQKSD